MCATGHGEIDPDPDGAGASRGFFPADCRFHESPERLGVESPAVGSAYNSQVGLGMAYQESAGLPNKIIIEYLFSRSAGDQTPCPTALSQELARRSRGVEN